MMQEPKPMREVHEWQGKVYDKNKRLSRKQRIEKSNRLAEEMIRRHGLKIKICQIDKAA
jgi:hypothetical protein